ncbi:MAG: hypothetical protein MJ217_00025 [Bacilli bacterium]|nr:hypothetical protein [Bacilli bacterium]
MKKKQFLLIIALPLLLVSCSKETTSSIVSTETSLSSSEVSKITSSISSEESKESTFSGVFESSSIVSSSSSSSNSSKESSSNRPSSSSSSSSKASSSSSKISSSSSVEEKKIDYTIDEWTNWQFYDDYGPTHNEDWEYLYGTSYNPNGVLFTTPNNKHTGDGIIFEDKGKQSITSPTFKAWKKVEIRYQLWFSNKTGKKGQNKKDDPTLIFDMYSLNGTKLGSENITIEKSKVPDNNVCYELKFYLRNINMNYFKMTYNSPVRINDDTGYAVVIHEISMRGWDYE